MTHPTTGPSGLFSDMYFSEKDLLAKDKAWRAIKNQGDHRNIMGGNCSLQTTPTKLSACGSSSPPAEPVKYAFCKNPKSQGIQKDVLPASSSFLRAERVPRCREFLPFTQISRDQQLELLELHYFNLINELSKTTKTMNEYNKKPHYQQQFEQRIAKSEPKHDAHHQQPQEITKVCGVDERESNSLAYETDADIDDLQDAARELDEFIVRQETEIGQTRFTIDWPPSVRASDKKRQHDEEASKFRAKKARLTN